MIKKITFLLVCLIMLSGCSKKEKPITILCFATGTVEDSYTSQELYNQLQKVNKDLDGKVQITINQMGYNKDTYASTMQALVQKDYDIFILGDTVMSNYGEAIIQNNTDKKFFSLESYYENEYENNVSLSFHNEEIGYLAGVICSSLSPSKKVGFLSDERDLKSNQTYYGFLQGMNKNGSEIKVNKKSLETQSNQYVKAMDYMNYMNDLEVDTVYVDVNMSIAGALDAAIVNNTIIIGATTDQYHKFQDDDLERANTIATSVVKNTSVLLEKALKSYMKNEELFGTSKIFGVADGAISIVEGDNLKTFNSEAVKEIQKEYRLLKDTTVVQDLKEHKSEFAALSKEKELNGPDLCGLQYSIEAQYNEANPNTTEGIDWKEKPRIGKPRPATWKSVGQWATFYLQDGCKYVKNTGIEIKNMKLYGYSPSKKEWVLLAHSLPRGNFYDESFTNDYNKDFPLNRRFDEENKSTIIHLDETTKGFNYHPFSEQLDLEELDMTDVSYVISTAEVRLVKWDESGVDDLDEARYVGNIGGDWWIKRGAVWQPDWGANFDIAIGQYQTITREWKSLYMTTVPSNLYSELIPTDFIK